GGIGLGFIIVMVNVAIAGLIASLAAKLNWKSIAAPTLGDSVRQSLVVALAVSLIYAGGLAAMSKTESPPKTTVTVLQGNFNIDMQKRDRGYTLGEIFDRYKNMSAHCPSGLCVWTES